ncbi:MerR family transcriptional regulator [Nitrosococcus halophilus Nc 4]|uniref:MerR family transcriptional regulator n=1 Tax=Nitrosococcus halophilus (strain Nc4) TaxID=472759 RepID=D5BZV3_NITHN|nr:chaperone modulator CbpM [Nitrosococcus halophilus]ADE16200.1 MerR family transcriptional regulator [Nitrosococcus halophilus Nc 4]
MKNSVVTGVVIDEDHFTLTELTEICGITPETVFEMVELGLLNPQGSRPEQWLFPGVAARRVRQVLRLSEDLEVNMAGAILAVELLEERERLQAQVRELEYRLSLLC